MIKEWEKKPDEGAIAIMDNVSSHSNSMLKELMPNAHHDYEFLPAWSPFLSPIEDAFAERKAKMRKLFAARRQSNINIDDQPRGAKF